MKTDGPTMLMQRRFMRRLASVGPIAALLLTGASLGAEPAAQNRAPSAMRSAARPRARYTDGRLPARDPPRRPGSLDAWGDERFFHDWHIQRNALSGHCRLLDGLGQRHAWGTFDECLARLEAIRRQHRLPPMRGTAVVVLHGLDGSPETMRPLAAYLGASRAMHVLNFGYPSRRGELVDHARALAGVVEHLDEIDQLHVVAFGLGNVVVRRWLADRAKADGAQPSQPPLRRLVMLAPPNQTSGSARDDLEMLVSVLGFSAKQLDGGWESLAAQLAVPRCEFGILAGGRGDERGLSTRLSGDDDGALSVAVTHLDGARDFLVVPVEHAQLPSDRRVLAATLEFLKSGSFAGEQGDTNPKR